MTSRDQLENEYFERQNKTAYPYLDVQGKWYNSLKRAVAPINPFALEQSSSKPRLNMGVFSAMDFIQPDIFPAQEKPSAIGVAHFDPKQDMYPTINESRTFGFAIPPEQLGHLAIVPDEIPRVCTRQLNIYKRCAMINGPSKCSDEAGYFLATCPTFALDDLRNGKLFNAKAKVIQRQEYRDAMEISPYNKGRSVRDVDVSVNYRRGTGDNLRADSFWIDDRYADVTQEDIDAAKARVAARNAAQGHSAGAHGHHDGHKHGHGKGHH